MATGATPAFRRAARGALPFLALGSCAGRARAQRPMACAAGSVGSRNGGLPARALTFTPVMLPNRPNHSWRSSSVTHHPMLPTNSLLLGSALMALAPGVEACVAGAGAGADEPQVSSPASGSA